MSSAHSRLPYIPVSSVFLLSIHVYHPCTPVFLACLSSVHACVQCIPVCSQFACVPDFHVFYSSMNSCFTCFCFTCALAVVWTLYWGVTHPYVRFVGGKTWTPAEETSRAPWLSYCCCPYPPISTLLLCQASSAITNQHRHHSLGSALRLPSLQD